MSESTVSCSSMMDRCTSFFESEVSVSRGNGESCSFIMEGERGWEPREPSGLSEESRRAVMSPPPDFGTRGVRMPLRMSWAIGARGVMRGVVGDPSALKPMPPMAAPMLTEGEGGIESESLAASRSSLAISWKLALSA